MKVLIGSRERLDFSAKRIFGKRIVLFVEPQFYEEYKEKHPDLEIVDIKENNKGIGYLYNQFVDYTLKNGEKYYLCCDDDIYGLKKRTTGKLENVKEEDIDRFLKEGESIIRTMELAKLGASFQAYNWTYSGILKFNVPVWALVFIDAEAIKKCGGYDEDIKVLNDYEMQARVLSEGYRTASWYEFAFAHKMRTGKGGAEYLYDNNSVVDYACTKIFQRYKDFCKIIVKDNHRMNEVRINFKKLYENASVKI